MKKRSMSTLQMDIEAELAELKERVTKLEQINVRLGHEVPTCSRCDEWLSKYYCDGCNSQVCRVCDPFFFEEGPTIGSYCTARCARRRWYGNYAGEVGDYPRDDDVKRINAALDKLIAREDEAVGR